MRIQRQSDDQYWNGTSWQAAVVWLPATGTSSWSRAFAPGNDEYTASSRATDSAGNVGALDNATFTVDTIAPGTPSATATTPSSPSNDNQPEVRGTGAEGGSTVRIYSTSDCSGTAIGTGSAADFNSATGITATVPANQTTNLRAAATDPAGNVSDCSAAHAYTEDSQAPGAVSITATTPPSPSSDDQPEVRGSGAEAASTVRIYSTSNCTGTPIGTGPAADFNSATGITATVPANQTTNLRATATDAAGNASNCSAAFPYTEDSQAPDAPSITATLPDSPANDHQPEVRGTAEAGSTVHIYSTSDCTGDPIGTGSAADFNTATGITVTVPENQTTNLRATATDAVGHTSDCSAARAYVEDSTTPASSITFPAEGGRYRAATFSAGCSTAGTPDACGTASDTGGSGLAAVEVRIQRQSDSQYWNGTSWQAGVEWLPATGTSPWSRGFTPGDDQYTLSSRATDAAGNVESTDTATFTVDITAPARPSIDESNPESPSNVNNPKLIGSAEAGSTVRLYRSGDCTGSVMAAGPAVAFADPDSAPPWRTAGRTSSR